MERDSRKRERTGVLSVLQQLVPDGDEDILGAIADALDKQQAALNDAPNGALRSALVTSIVGTVLNRYSDSPQFRPILNALVLNTSGAAAVAAHLTAAQSLEHLVKAAGRPVSTEPQHCAVLGNTGARHSLTRAA